MENTFLMRQKSKYCAMVPSILLYSSMIPVKKAEKNEGSNVNDENLTDMSLLFLCLFGALASQRTTLIVVSSAGSPFVMFL